jgi:Low molecular weight phosphotyrosine protein phosphatase
MADRPSVLFVCIHNAGRSQMAAGFLRELAGDAVAVRSAGSDPAARVSPAAVEAMREVGIDISDQTPKVITDEAVQSQRRHHHHGLRRCLPGLPWQKLPGLAASGSGRQGRRGGPADPR